MAEKTATRIQYLTKDFLATWSISYYECANCGRVSSVVFQDRINDTTCDTYECPRCQGKPVTKEDRHLNEFKSHLFYSGALRCLWENHIVPIQETEIQPLAQATVETWPEPQKIELSIPQPITTEPIPQRRGVPQKTRLEVWKRNGPYCQVCGLRIPQSCYHCGHIVDQFVGGSDDPDNLIVMDEYCNQQKPFHRTKKAYEEWLASGYWVAEWIEDSVNRISFDKHPDLILEILSDLPGTPEQRVMHYLKQSIRYRQMQQLGLIYQAPHISKWAERWNTDECPEWKKHG